MHGPGERASHKSDRGSVAGRPIPCHSSSGFLMQPRDLFDLLKQTVYAWIGHSAFTLAAALAYYALFSIAPLLLIAISIVGLALGADAARAGVMEQVRSMVGEPGAGEIEQLLVS